MRKLIAAGALAASLVTPGIAFAAVNPTTGCLDPAAMNASLIVQSAPARIDAPVVVQQSDVAQRDVTASENDRRADAAERAQAQQRTYLRQLRAATSQ